MENLVTGLGIHIKVASIDASRAFYENILELKPIFAYGDTEFLTTVPSGVPTAPEKYRGVTYEVGGARLEIADGHIAVSDEFVFSNRVDSPKVSAMVQVSSLVPLLEDRKLVPNSPVKKYYWGTIEMVVRDPDGWVIVLISPYSDAEWGRVAELTETLEVNPS